LTHETRYSYPPTPPDIMFTVNPFALVDKSDPTAKIPIDKLPTPLVKLTDFGLARFIDPTSPMLQTRCGSESFTAPEIIMGNPYDGRDTDSWAVGVILFALVTGELPFDRVTSATAHDEEAQRRKRIMAIAKGDYKWPIGVGSEGVKKVVARLLTRDASKRTRVGPALWDEIWMHGPGSVLCPPCRQPGATDETLPDGRIKLLDGFLFNKDIELEARRDAF
jgi:tRNA (cytidine32/guanosine34-2'-O)-methyltransferase